MVISYIRQVHWVTTLIVILITSEVKKIVEDASRADQFLSVNMLQGDFFRREIMHCVKTLKGFSESS